MLIMSRKGWRTGSLPINWRSWCWTRDSKFAPSFYRFLSPFTTVPSKPSPWAETLSNSLAAQALRNAVATCMGLQHTHLHPSPCHVRHARRPVQSIHSCSHSKATTWLRGPHLIYIITLLLLKCIAIRHTCHHRASIVNLLRSLCLQVCWQSSWHLYRQFLANCTPRNGSAVT